jgi:hypothetical protein
MRIEEIGDATIIQGNCLGYIDIACARIRHATIEG